MIIDSDSRQATATSISLSVSKKVYLYSAKKSKVTIRDVNSSEVAFPGGESQFPGLDRYSRFRPSTYFYLHDRSWIAGGGAKGGRGDHRPDPAPFPADDGTHRRLRTINIVGSGAPKMAGGRVRGSATGKAQRPSAPGRQAGESPPLPVGRRWTREG